MKSVLIVFVLIQVIFGAKLPSDYKRCPKTNHKRCLIQACQEVMRKLSSPSLSIGLPSIDPMDIPAMTIAAGTGAVIFDQKYTNLKVYGFSTMKVLNAEFDFDRKILHFADLIKNLTIDSNYEVDGKLLILPVKGSGLSTVVMASDYKRCPKTNHKDCLTEACQEVLGKLSIPSPGIGLPSIDPLQIPSLTVGAGTGPVNFEQKFTDIKVCGFSKTKVLRVEFDFEKKILHLEFFMKNTTTYANCEVDGKLLVIPVKGSALSTIDMDDLEIAIDLPFTEYRKKGKTYLKFDGVSLRLNPGHVSYKFDNLFNGDRVLGDNINKVLNENWKDVFDDVKPGYEQAYGLIVENLCNQVFSRVPLSNVFVD